MDSQADLEGKTISINSEEKSLVMVDIMVIMERGGVCFFFSKYFRRN